MHWSQPSQPEWTHGVCQTSLATALCHLMIWKLQLARPALKMEIYIFPAQGSFRIALMQYLKIQIIFRRNLTTSTVITITPLHKTIRPLLIPPNLGPFQSHSAPARGWDFGGFERSDSCAVLQYDGSSPVKENEPWSHLQTFALSAPGYDRRSSQDFQIAAGSQRPSSLQDNEMLHPTTVESHHQHQVLLSHRMQANPSCAEGSFTQYPRLRNGARSGRGPRSANIGIFEHRTPSSGEQQIVGSSSSSRLFSTRNKMVYIWGAVPRRSLIHNPPTHCTSRLWMSWRETMSDHVRILSPTILSIVAWLMSPDNNHFLTVKTSWLRKTFHGDHKVTCSVVINIAPRPKQPIRPTILVLPLANTIGLQRSYRPRHSIMLAVKIITTAIH